MNGSKRTALPTPEQQYLEEAVPMRIGVACSGGGIRSAAFSLGALQALQDEKLFPRVEYIAAVSGGNYIASALAITAATSDAGSFDEQPPWAQGSPEERHLRHHTDYLAPGITGRLWLAANFVYGFVVNYLPFLLGAFVLGRIVGWLMYYALGSSERAGLLPADGERSDVARFALIAVAAVLVFVALSFVLHRRLTDGRNDPSPHAARTEAAGGRVFGLGLALLLLVVLAPTIVRAYDDLSRWTVDRLLRRHADAYDNEPWSRIAVAGIWLLVALLVAVVALALSRRSQSRVLTVLAGVGASGLLVVPFVSSFSYSSSHGVSDALDVLGPVAAAAVLLLMAVFVHNRRYSLHLFYRERLCTVYAVARRRNGHGDYAAVPLEYGERIELSKVGADLEPSTAGGARLVPKLVVCCAVNVTSHDAPIGRFASSYTFEPGRSGSPLLDYRDTTDFEEDGLVKGTGLTLPSMMAVSGAALSPMMGRFTHPALRFLMALTNVRLGVWIPNKHRPDYDVEQARERAEADREAAGRLRRLRHAIVAGWREPGAWYVLREAIGTTGGKNRFIYVSDGGHFENLGLVELIRRRCTHILCFDASLDPDGDALDIGRAIALARADLGAEIEIDPTPTLIGDDGVSGSMVAVGHVRYPDGERATLIFTRAALTDSASWDLRSLSKRDRRFPHHSTRQQLFTDEQFQAYRSLGYQGGRESVARLNLPPVLLEYRDDRPAAGPDALAS